MPHPSTSSAYGIWSLNEVRDAERGDNWPEYVLAQLMVNVYNESTSASQTGSFVIPAWMSYIYVYGAAGGGSGGLYMQADNASAGREGGAANLSGYQIAVT